MQKFLFSAALLAAALTSVSVAPARAEEEAVVATTATAPAAAPAAAEITAQKGDRLYDAAGRSIAKIDEVLADGSVQIMLNSAVVTVPSASLSSVDGKLTTSLSRRELRRMG